MRALTYAIVLPIMLAACGGQPAAPSTAGSAGTPLLTPAAPSAEAATPGLAALAPAQAPAPRAPLRASGPAAIEVDVGERHGCVLFEGGELRCWGGHDGNSRPAFGVETIALPGVAQVAAGGWFTCARLERGEVHCWGNLPGASATPTAVPLSGPAVEIACGMSHACARLASGRVECWGSNGSGALGARELRPFDAPVEVQGVRGAERVVAGHAHSCARVERGRVLCWGETGRGELGRRVGTAAVGPLSGAEGAVEVVAGGYHTCVLLEGGRARCWGSFEGAEERFEAREIALAAPIVSLALARAHACAATAEGSVWCWGNGRAGQLGDGGRAVTLAPVRVAMEGARAVTTGNELSCALRAQGEVACWGNASEGRLPPSVTRREAPAPVPGVTDAIQVAGSSRTTCALTRPGGVVCWGARLEGSSTSPPAPVEGLSGAISIAVGPTHGCAVMPDRTLRCFGANHDGQLGTGDTRPRAGAVAVPGVRDVSQVVIDGTATCAVTAQGVWCWGGHTAALLGLRARAGETGVHPRPARVAGIGRVDELALHGGNACARGGDRVLCWGRHREHGERCAPGPTDATVCTGFVSPVPTALDAVSAVVRLELDAERLVRGDGSAYLLDFGPVELERQGHTSLYRVGASAEPTTEARTTGCWVDAERRAICEGRRVPGLGEVRGVAAGREHVCALRDDGSVWCWGENAQGQLGTAAPNPGLPNDMPLR